MLKQTLLVSLLFTVGLTQAQEFNNPNLQAMVDAERAFVKMAKEQNRRDAFLYYLSDDVITSGPDGIKRGKEEIKKQPITNDWLFWEVAYCDMAACGDFGFNTGPWEMRMNKTDEKPVAWGEFNSIWKKQADGTWKNVLDIGTRHGAPVAPITTTTSSKPLISKKSKSSSKTNDALEMEKKFLVLLQKDRKAAYEKYLSSEARIVHSNQLPLITPEEKKSFLNETKVPTDLKLMDGETASSHDLGYVYGTAKMTITRKDKTKEVTATYVRVWKKEDGKKWKIVLDVLSY